MRATGEGSMATMTRSRWSTDLTLFCELLASRLRSEGCPHPTSAAVAIAVRGRHGGDQQEFADDVGLTIEQVRAMESGEVAYRDFPRSLVLRARATDGLDLGALGVDPPGAGPETHAPR